SRSPEQTLELGPGVLSEISARFPEGADEATVVLSGDAFTLDDRLPLVRPAPKPLVVAVDGKDEPAEFFRKLVANIDGVTTAATGVAVPPARLRIARLSVEEMTREPRGGIFWPPADARKDTPLATDSVT